MSYIDDVVQKVNNLFDQNQDIHDLQMKVIGLIKDTAKESFKNGLATARNKQSKYKGQKANDA